MLVSYLPRRSGEAVAVVRLSESENLVTHGIIHHKSVVAEH